MIQKAARISAVLLLAFLIAGPNVASAQDKNTSPTTSSASKSAKDTKDTKDNKKDDKKKKKNSDVDNIGNRNINKGSINFLSLQKEIEMGRQAAAEIERQVKLLDDPTINEYVNRVGQNIVRNSDAKVPFTIKVVDSDEINAFALPGGFFYVNTGLILAADDEAELAGVMAHEIAHVAARHGAEQQTKGEIINIASIPLIFLGGVGGYAIRQASGILVPVGFLKFSRNAEEEADYLGIQYLYKTGYDPGAMVSMFEKLQARESAKPGSVSSLFSTHPPTGDRIEKTKVNIEGVLQDKDEYVITTSEFGRIKTQLAALENRRPAEESNKPSLKRRTPSGRTDPNGGDTDSKSPSNTKDTKDTQAGSGTTDNKTDADKQPADDDRPTLKRRNP